MSEISFAVPWSKLVTGRKLERLFLVRVLLFDANPSSTCRVVAFCFFVVCVCLCVCVCVCLFVCLIVFVCFCLFV